MKQEKECRKEQKVKQEKQNNFIKIFQEESQHPVEKGGIYDNLLSARCCTRQVPSCQAWEMDDHTHK